MGETMLERYAMTSPKNRINILSMIAEVEEAIAYLYQAYADSFPEYKLWSGLVVEQIDSADLVRGLTRKAGEGSMQFYENKVHVERMHSFQNRLQSELARAKEKGISLANALSIALDIEKNLERREYLEAFDTNTLEAANLLSMLAEMTDRRIKLIEKHLESQRLQ